MNKAIEIALSACFVAVLSGGAVYAIGGQTKQVKAEVPSSFVVLSKDDMEDGTLMILADLSLIPISEPTRRNPISYAEYC